MEYLDIAIAFSIIMLSLAQFANLTIAALNKRLKTRKSEFGKWHKVVEKHVDDILQARSVNAQTKDAFNKELQEIVSLEKETKTPWLNRSVVSELAINQLTNDRSRIDIDKLRTTALLIEDGLSRIDAEFTDRFRINAMAKAMVISLIIAFALNINSIALVSYLHENPQATSSVIQERIVQLETIADTSVNPTQSTIARVKLQQREKQLENFENLRNKGMFPGYSNDFKFTWTYLFGCLLTGLLAGLGAPFWHTQLTRLLTIRNQVNTNSPPPVAVAPEGNDVLPTSTIPNNIEIPSGLTGSFVVSNPLYDGATQNIDVDIAVVGTPEQVLTWKELTDRIQSFYSKNKEWQIKSVNIRPLSHGTINSWLFVKNM